MYRGLSKRFAMGSLEVRRTAEYPECGRMTIAGRVNRKMSRIIERKYGGQRLSPQRALRYTEEPKIFSLFLCVLW
jgi:hypothetical protein